MVLVFIFSVTYQFVCWRMTWLTLPTGLLLLLVVTLCVSSAKENETVQVLYPQKTFTPARGSSVTLSCKAFYDFMKCGLLHVAWYHLTKDDAELTDPKKYFTTVNETISDGIMRLRQVETEILNLTSDDNGQFQCKAGCENQETAMGHFITITVTD